MLCSRPSTSTVAIYLLFRRLHSFPVVKIESLCLTSFPRHFLSLCSTRFVFGHADYQLLIGSRTYLHLQSLVEKIKKERCLPPLLRGARPIRQTILPVQVRLPGLHVVLASDQGIRVGIVSRVPDPVRRRSARVLCRGHGGRREGQ